jgi:diapolycopene oxygenase
LPDDPTIYVVAASKTDPSVAPAGCDCLKILPHLPHISDTAPITREEYARYKEFVIA